MKIILKKIIVIVLLFFLLISCKKKPENLINRIGGDAHLIERNSFEFKDSLSIQKFNQGIKELRNENLIKAGQLFLEANRIEPKNTTILNALGSNEADLNNFDKAYEYFEKSINLNPKNTLTYMSYGVALNKSTEQNKAIEIWKKGLNIEFNHEKSGYFNYNIANAYYKLKKYEISKKYNDKALKIVSDKEVRKYILELDKLLKKYNNKAKQKVKLYEKDANANVVKLVNRKTKNNR